MRFVIPFIRIVFIPFLVCITIINNAQSQSGTNSFAEIFANADKLLSTKKPQEVLNLLTPILSSKAELNKTDSLNLFYLLGDSYFLKQDYTKAVSNYQVALTSSDSNDTLKARIFNQIGLSKYRLSEYSNAVSNIIQARNLYRQLFGTKDVKYTQTLNTLGFLYNVQAKYSEAEKTFTEAKQISFQINGGEDIQYARIINNLATVYSHLNRYEKADELFKTSLRIKAKVSGKQSKDYANTLYNLADFYSDIGRYSKAKTCIQEGIEIFNGLKETTHPDYFKFLDYLALLEEKLDHQSEAERLLKESLQRREKESLTDRDDYALNLMNLGNLLLNSKEYKMAYPYIDKATNLILKIYGKNHPTYAKVLITLATIQSKQNENDQALKNYKSAVQILQTTLGSDNIEYFHAQYNFAKFLRKTDQKQEAITIIKKINSIPQVYLKRVGRFLSEKELNDKVNEFVDYLHEVYSFVRELPSNEDLCSIAYDLNLFYRSYILNQMQRIRITMFKAQQVNETRDEIISLHRQLENELNRPINERSNVAEIEKLISEKESEISNKIGSLSDEESISKWEDIRTALAEDEAAIEFVSFPDEKQGDSTYVGALLMKYGFDKPMYIDLCSEAELSLVIQAKGGRTSDYISELYNFSNRGAAVIETKKKSLFELVWEPYVAQLNGVKKLYLIPDGLLHRISFSAIPTSLENVVSDSIQLIYLGSSKQVIPNDQKILSYNSNRSLIIGGVKYDTESSDLVASRSGNQTKQQWNYLPWAAKESQDVSDLLKTGGQEVCYLKGADASEKNVMDSLTSQHGFRVLHFATHGYFKGSVDDNSTSNSNYYGKGLINSALVLSGANSLNSSNTANESDDGMLTAYSISKLDLSQTELVVLSACETALGDIKEIEGVYGMQRAFKLAGANQLILSLWQIPDRETKDFMLGFYKNWLNNQYSVREAFYKTQSEFRQRFVNPYQWAGFILIE